MTDIEQLWQRVERWMDAEPRLPHPDEIFKGPATATEIEAAERALGQEFPESFHASLLIHDGQRIPRIDGNGNLIDGEVELVQWLPNQMVLLPLKDIVDRWQEERAFERELDLEEEAEGIGEHGRVRDFPTVTHSGRLPIAEQEGSSYLYLDFVPSPAGKPGQVTMTRNECEFIVVGNDFADFLARYVAMLERGVLRYDADEYHSVVPPNPRSWDDHLYEI